MSNHHVRRALRVPLIAVLTAALAVGLGLPAGVGFGPAPAAADTRPEPGTPPTVTAHNLPTWQVNGVVWSQVVVGNTVYVGGSFSAARPPGVPAGGVGEIPAQNLFAYDIRTGNPVPGFSHNANGQVLALATSPDGRRLYVGGDFTTVDGQPRGHLAAFETATGVLVADFAPAVNGQVRAITVSADTVYAGGSFTNVGTVFRYYMAAFGTTGQLRPWQASPDGRQVMSMVLAPDGSKVIVGGQFAKLNGQFVNGHGALDPVTGANLPWAVNQVVKDSDKGGITSLTTDGRYVYGTGFAFGTGGFFEGVYAADPSDGSIVWLADCQGDSYSAAATSDAVYVASHHHNCSMVDSFPEAKPRVHLRANAFTKAVKGVNKGPNAYGWNYAGQPAPGQLHWFPYLQAGSYTGQGQAAWSVVANEDFVALGGEFPNVNNQAQQGLTRMSKASVNARTRPPTFQSLPARTVLPTRAVAITAASVRVSFQTAWDMDNERLTYEVFRNYGKPDQSLVSSQQVATNFYTLPDRTVVDRPAPGTYTYRVRVSDGTGNSVLSDESGPATTTEPQGPYAAQVISDGATSYWRLGEPSEPTMYDSIGALDATATGGLTRGVPGAVNDGNAAVSFDGTGWAATSAAIDGPATFSIESWFRTDSRTGGKIVGFGNSRTGDSASSDRHVYLDATGRLWFGVYPGSYKTVSSVDSYNDNQWHQVVATLDPVAGMTLYVDGRRVAADRTATSARTQSGYWRIGGDRVTGWPSAPSTKNLSGTIDDVAVYGSALSPAQIADHYTKSGRTLPPYAAPTDAYGAAVTADQPSLYWRFDEAAGRTAADATGRGNTGVYSAGGLTYGTPSTIGNGTSVRLGGSSGAITAASNETTTKIWSGQIWFRSTSTRGGLLFGLGNTATGLSTVTDRTVSLTNAGQVRFSTGGAADVNIVSPQQYNDGQWHQVTATQDQSGMSLYVDGLPVAANAVQVAEPITGYWRVGYDRVAAGSASNYLAGDVDEFAIYDRTLAPVRVKAQYAAGGGRPANLPPTVEVELTANGNRVSATALAGDPDGTIAETRWDFGDGSAPVTAAAAEHDYASAGTYTVTATVTDNEGATTTAAGQVTVTNAAPTAAFTATATGLSVALDAGASSDADGTVAGYAWDFGDGSTGTGVTAGHQYAATGSYPVTLTVTDDRGATGTTTKNVSVERPNLAPGAAFAATVQGRAVSVDASASNDPDGTVASYAWDFGDGTTGSGRTATHTYQANGTYTVRLIVTDDSGTASDAVTRPVQIDVPLLSDSFTRTTTNGWGSPDVGSAWTYLGGASGYSVDGAAGRLRLTAGGGLVARQASISSTSTDLRLQVALDKLPSAGSAYVWATARGSSSDGYAAKIAVSATGATSLQATRTVGGSESALATGTTGVTFAPAARYNVRVQAIGTATTTVRAKMWPVGAAEPAAWQVTGTDTTAALQAPAGVAVRGYLSGLATNAPLVLSLDDIVARTAE